MKKPLALLLIILVSFIAISWVAAFVPLDITSDRTMTFTVVKGEGSREIGLNLERQGLILWGPLFRVYVLTVGASYGLQAGDYELSPAMSMRHIANKMKQGDVKREMITVIEGWNVKDIAKALETQGIIAVSGFVENYSSLEGYLFPDTYHVEQGMETKTLVEAMQKNFEKKTAVLEPQIQNSKKSLADIVTMASLIEKEVQTLEDKKLVSDILWRRMQAGIPLQVDATIAYITGKKTTEISREETQIDSPYNTYKYRGLPQGPIGNPGLESIQAALEPQNNPNWYYLSKPTGETVFSKTLEEHNIAKALYLK